MRRVLLAAAVLLAGCSGDNSSGRAEPAATAAAPSSLIPPISVVPENAPAPLPEDHPALAEDPLFFRFRCPSEVRTVAEGETFNAVTDATQPESFSQRGWRLWFQTFNTAMGYPIISRRLDAGQQYVVPTLCPDPGDDPAG